MKWYFTLSGASIDRPDHDWRGLVRVAVSSARQKTTLRPHLVYDGEENEFIAELREMDVQVISHRVSFHNHLTSRGPDYLKIALGTFLRVEIPNIEREDEFVLYTDCDVVFRRDPQLNQKPRYFAAAPQSSMTDYFGDMNAGVMLMNIRALRADLPEFIKFIIDNLHQGWPGFDQENYRRFYKKQWDRLDLTLNWKLIGALTRMQSLCIGTGRSLLWSANF